MKYEWIVINWIMFYFVPYKVIITCSSSQYISPIRLLIKAFLCVYLIEHSSLVQPDKGYKIGGYG